MDDRTRGAKRSDLDEGPKSRAVGISIDDNQLLDMGVTRNFQASKIRDIDSVQVPSSNKVTSYDDFLAQLPVPIAAPLPKQQGARLVEIVVEPLPEWIEKYTSFYSRTPPARLMEYLPSILSDLAVDFEPIGPCQIQIVGPRFCCVVQIFQAKEEFVVEFQRRSGDVCSFTAFYRTALGKLGSVVTRSFVTNASILPPRPLAALDLSSLLDDLEEDTQDDGAVLHRLFEMAQTNFVDVEREAFQELSALSASPRTREQLMGQLDLVVRTVCSLLSKPHPDEMCVGSAVSLLANLCATGSLQMGSVVQPPLLRQLFVLATSPATLINRSTVRSALSTLARLSTQPKMAKVMLAVSQSYMPAISRFVSDDRLGGSALALMSNLDA